MTAELKAGMATAVPDAFENETSPSPGNLFLSGGLQTISCSRSSRSRAANSSPTCR